MSYTHTVECINTLKDPSFGSIVFEVQQPSDIDTLIQHGVPSDIVDLVHKNINQALENRKKVLYFYLSFSQAENVIFFFPETKSLMDDRCDFFRKIENNTLFVPTSHWHEAHESLVLSTYKYQEYISEKKTLKYWLVVPSWVEKDIKKISPLYSSIFWARDVINRPPIDAYPEAIVRDIQKRNWKHFDVHIFWKKELKGLGCNLLLAVGAGSNKDPYMVVLSPKKQNKNPGYALIGKGVTFDAGWIQIKPDSAMLDMKCDMAGAAWVLWVAMYLDTLEELPANIVVAVWLTENMTGDNAFKPLDIYTAHNGTTVEIHHTDAEWRLVLADVMSYVESTYAPEHIITMATLTGACIYALWNDIAGVIWDDEEVISTLIASSSPYEKLWRLPLNEKIKKSLKADIADIKNLTKTEKAGASVGWAFLSYFQWRAKLTHLDIAGPAYRETEFGYMPKGWTGWWVKLLSEYLISLKNEK